MSQPNEGATTVAEIAQAIESRMEPEAPIEEEVTEVTSETEEPSEVTEAPTEEIAEETDEITEEDAGDVSEDPGTDEDNEASQFENVYELAEAVGMEPDQFLSQIKAKVKVDGVETEIPLSEAFAGYQKEADYRKKTMDLADQRRAFEAETTQEKQQLAQRVMEAGQLLANLESQIVGEYNAVNWDELRVEDPAEYAAKIADFQQRQQGLQQLKVQGQSEFDNLQREANAQQQTALKEKIAEENQKLVQRIDGWDNPEKAEKEFGEIVGYLMNDYQFSAEDIHGTRDAQGNFITPGIVDSRLVELSRKAMLYDQLDKTKPMIKNKVNKLPKVLKPGAKPDKVKAEAEAARKKQQALLKSGRKEDLAKALIDRM